MTFITDFADQAVVLPVVLAVAAVLAMTGRWRRALLWPSVIGAIFLIVLLLKLGFLACGPVFDPWSLRSPSGHTAAASVVAGCLAALLTARFWAVLSIALLAALAVGFSRLELGFHSIPEIVLGGALGVAGAALFARLSGKPPEPRPVSLLAIVAVVAVLLHGTRLPAEAAIQKASIRILDFVPACRG